MFTDANLVRTTWSIRRNQLAQAQLAGSNRRLALVSDRVSVVGRAGNLFAHFGLFCRPFSLRR